METKSPAEAWEMWISQSVIEFMAESEGQTIEQAVNEYCDAIERGEASQAAFDELGRGPTERERQLLIEYVRAHVPVPPADLIDSTEAARLLGWDRRKVATYHGRGVLPKPVKQFAGGPVWRRQDIEAYAPVNAVYVHTNAGDYILARNGARLGVDPQVMADFRAAEGQLDDWANWSSPELWDGEDIMAAARETGDVVALYRGSVLSVEDEERWAERIEFFGPRN